MPFKNLHSRVYFRVLAITIAINTAYDTQWNKVATWSAWSSNNSPPLYFNFSNMVNFGQIFDPLKIQNVSTFHFEKGSAKSTNFSFYIKGHYFVMAVMGGPIDVNIGVVWEIYMGFLKNKALQQSRKCRQFYGNFNVKSSLNVYGT